MHLTKHVLASKFDMKDIGEASVILDIKIITRDNDIKITQEYYVKKLSSKPGAK